MMGTLVQRDDFGGWTQLTLNRPDKLNALTVALFAELRAHIVDLKSDDSVRCVVLRGAGNVFPQGTILPTSARARWCHRAGGTARRCG